MPTPPPPERPRIGLVLNAGGARGAYQTGVLEVLLPALEARGERPTVLVGVSAGALNVCLLAASAHLPAEQQVASMVEGLFTATKPAVVRPLWRQLPVTGLRYGAETLGLPVARQRGMLGTGPLAGTLTRLVDWGALHSNVERGHLEAVTLLATVVRTGRVVAFTETPGELPETPPGSDVVYRRARLGVPHAMASAAIPVLFPSVRISDPPEAAGWYVDGATRLRTPLRPAVELGVDKLLVVGTTSLRPRESDPEQDSQDVDVGDSAVTLLNAMLDDALREDVRRLGELNAFFGTPAQAALREYREARGRRPFRSLPYAAIAPDGAGEIDDLAREVYARRYGRPWQLLTTPDVQLLHRALGSDSPLQGELLSFLLFDEEFFAGLREMGRRDGEAWLATHPDVWRTDPVETLDGTAAASSRTGGRSQG